MEKTDSNGSQSPQVELTFSADIEHPAPKSNGKGQSSEDQRCGVGEGF